MYAQSITGGMNMKSDRSRPRYPIVRAEIDAPASQDIYAIVDPIRRVMYRNRAAHPDANVIKLQKK